jgi:hypothetical protein
VTMDQAVALVNKYRRIEERVREMVNEPIVFSHQTRQGHEKKRRCLKCGRRFRTTNNVRTCSKCSIKNQALGIFAAGVTIHRKEEF